MLYNRSPWTISDLCDVQGTPRFIADSMLGKLVKWLRVLGIDVVYERLIEDQELVHRARAENRWLLTRDRRLVQRRWSGTTRFILVEKDDWPSQLRQVLRYLKPPRTCDILTRCVRCNEYLKFIPRKVAANSVPPYVFNTQRRFVQCPGCERIYWRGTHPKQIIKRLRDLITQPHSPRKKTGSD